MFSLVKNFMATTAAEFERQRKEFVANKDAADQEEAALNIVQLKSLPSTISTQLFNARAAESSSPPSAHPATDDTPVAAAVPPAAAPPIDNPVVVPAASNDPSSKYDDLLPWKNVPDEDALKKQILALSSDRRTFIANPPEGTDFVFEMNFKLAKALLNADPQLQRMRYELVPKTIKEFIFWKNYFYRVNLVRFSALSDIVLANSNNNVASIVVPSAVEVLPATAVTSAELQSYAPPAADVVSESIKKSEGFETDSEEFISENWEEELEKEIQG